MYTKVSVLKSKEKQDALLWLFLTEKGQVEEFTEFCRLRQGLSFDEIDEAIRLKISEGDVSPDTKSENPRTNITNQPKTKL